MVTRDKPRARSLAEVEQHLASLYVRQDEQEKLIRDFAQRFDTLQTPWWRRLWFRIDGWPGQRDLNAPQRARRPWHR